MVAAVSRSRGGRCGLPKLECPVFDNSTPCCKATCPDYMGPVIFILVVWMWFLSLFYSTRPGWVVKAGSVSTDPGNVDFVVAALYSLLFTAIILLAIFLLVRCACKCV